MQRAPCEAMGTERGEEPRLGRRAHSNAMNTSEAMNTKQGDKHQRGDEYQARQCAPGKAMSIKRGNAHQARRQEPKEAKRRAKLGGERQAG